MQGQKRKFNDTPGTKPLAFKPLGNAPLAHNDLDAMTDEEVEEMFSLDVERVIICPICGVESCQYTVKVRERIGKAASNLGR
jgi:hypothetical protein